MAGDDDPHALILDALRRAGRKLTEEELRDSTGLARQELGIALQSLRLAGQVELITAKPKRDGGGQGRRYIGCSWIELWKAVD